MAYSPEAAGQFNINDLAEQAQKEVSGLKPQLAILQERAKIAPGKWLSDRIDTLTAKIAKNETFLAGIEPSAEHVSKKLQENITQSPSALRDRLALALKRAPSVENTPSVILSPQLNEAKIGMDYDNLPTSEKGGSWDAIKLPPSERRAA